MNDTWVYIMPALSYTQGVFLENGDCLSPVLMGKSWRERKHLPLILVLWWPKSVYTPDAGYLDATIGWHTDLRNISFLNIHINMYIHIDICWLYYTLIRESFIISLYHYIWIFGKVASHIIFCMISVGPFIKQKLMLSQCDRWYFAYCW